MCRYESILAYKTSSAESRLEINQAIRDTKAMAGMIVLPIIILGLAYLISWNKFLQYTIYKAASAGKDVVNCRMMILEAIDL